MARVQSSSDTCAIRAGSALPGADDLNASIDGGSKFRKLMEKLPEFGIARFIEHNDFSPNEEETSSCKLPPPRSCDAKKVTAILMAYTEEGLKSLKIHRYRIFRNSPERDLVSEIVIVWNGPDRVSLEGNHPTRCCSRRGKNRR